ncbi:MAG: alpha/beta hydrolase [Sporolactobacillus sp.]
MLSEQAYQAIKTAQDIKAMQQDTLTVEAVYAARASADEAFESYRFPGQIRLEKVNTAEVKGEFYHFAENSHPQTVLLFVHGGAFATGTVKSRRKLCISIAERISCDSFSVDYRQWPEGHHPDGLHDLLHAYQWLIGKYKTIYLFGESAGATLALALTLKLKNENKPLPTKVCVFSPVINELNTMTSEFTHAERDPMLLGGGKPMPYFKEPWADSPLVSPIYGDYRNFPQLMIHCGSEEVKCDHAIVLNQLCQNAGVDTTLQIWQGLFHVFVLFDMPETERALNKIGTFFTTA